MWLTFLLIIIEAQTSVTEKPASKSADIVFLVASSNTSSHHIKTFMNKAINSLPLGPNESRVALAQYNDQIYNEFHLDTYKGKNPMLNHIKNKMTFRGGPLKTGSALRTIHEDFYWKPTIGKDRTKILVVITSQPSEDDIAEAAQMLKKAGVKVIALGIEDASFDELILMATKPFYFYFPRNEELNLFSQNISGIIADAVEIGNNNSDLSNVTSANKVNNGTALEACDGDAVADVVFIVDASSPQTKFKKIQLFLEDLVSSLDVREKCIRVGFVTYSTKPMTVSLLRMSMDKTHVLESIQSLSPQAGKSNTGSGIQFAREKVFTKSAGSRKSQGVEQIAVLITHRSSEDRVSDAATVLRRAGVTIFAIGIEGANATQLAQIAAYPPYQYITNLKTFSHLPRKTQSFHKKIVNQIQQTLYLNTKRTELLKRGCVDTEEADIYFLIDGSSSLDYFDFGDLKLFLKEVIKFFVIGPNKVRFGVVQYGENSELEFGLEEYGKTSDILKAIDNIRQTGGSPNTGAALTFIQLLISKSQRLHPRSVPCYLILLTAKTSEDQVEKPAERVRNEVVDIYAIGVGHANESQIYEIVKSKDRAYFVNDFASLKHIKNEVVQDICAVEACKEKKSDILFLVDSSESISPEDFLKMKNFMSELVNKSDVGPGRVHFGALQFSSKTKEEFRLNQYSTKSDVIDAIGRMSLMGQNMVTGGALQFVLDYFKPTKGARPYVKKILILITDGEAEDEVKIPAETLREENIIVYSVGGFNANKTQLIEISGKPEMVFYVEDFDVLKHLEGEILFGICSPYDECRRIELLDIVFIIDGSGSIDPKEYDIMKDFMIALVKKSDVGHDRVQFGAVKYSAEPETFFYLNDYGSKSAIIKAIQNDKSIGETTYTAKALRHSESLFSEEHGSRKYKGVPQVLIVITDGDSHDASELDEVSRRLRANGIVIYAIGIERARPDELLTMAGSEDKYFHVNTFEGLKHLHSNVSHKICSVSKPECGIPADLVFLIDGSNSISDSDFTKMKNFLQDVIRPFNTGHNVQVGIAQYSDRYQEEFRLNIFQRKSELETQIGQIRQMEGLQTYIGAALERVKSYFTPEGGSRINENIQQILLVITDGRSHDKVSKVAEDLRKKGVDIYAIGVGRIDQLQLSQIAGSSDRKYTVDNFSELKVIKKRLVDDICEEEDTTTCFMDVVVGIDVSSQSQGDPVFHGQYQLETHFPQIINALTYLTGVSCNARSHSQTSVAVKVRNTDPPVVSKFQIDSEKLLNSLVGTTIRNASHLNAEFLDSLWETFQIKSTDRRKVLLVFSDGLDDNVEVLEHKSEELRKRGLDALITVGLEGASNFNELQYIEFGKGFGYKTQLTIGMRNIASQLSKYVTNVAERTCCCVFCKCTGEEGDHGEQGRCGMKGGPGIQGSQGHLGDEGEPGSRGLPGPTGDKGYMGCQGNRGPKGQRGIIGRKGNKGEEGTDGINGEPGPPGHPGMKGENGDAGYQGSPGPKGVIGERGEKGFRGDRGIPGADNNLAGPRGLGGERGREGERGPTGPSGFPGSEGSRGWQGQKGQHGPQGRKGSPGSNGVPGQHGFKGPQGERGIRGRKGIRGDEGNKGFPGHPGVTGTKGIPGRWGTQGNKGEVGDPGLKGESGLPGLWGFRGDDGAIGYGGPGHKGVKGERGFPGPIGQKGTVGNTGIPGEPGTKGIRGQAGPEGSAGLKGTPGDHGPPGRKGVKGAKGGASLSPCKLIAYIREHSCNKHGTPECPAYPTELVFALDVSQDTTHQLFQHMKKIVIETVNGIKIRESNCPVGARVAIVSYSSDTRYLVRFSDFRSKSRLLQEVNALSYQRSPSRRDLGGSMRFVARNVFKRTLQGDNVRKVAVFFSNGQSVNPVSINTAVIEFSALNIVPAVIAFNNILDINQSFAMDDSGQYQVIAFPSKGDYTTFLHKLQLCTLCYDKCKPDVACARRTQPQEAYVDAVFILDSSQKIDPREFEKMKDFLSSSLDHFDVSSEPATSSVGDRIALVSHAPPAFQPHLQNSPVKVEFDLITYREKEVMKKHIQESVQQLGGVVAVGHAIQWTINNIFSEVPSPRKHKMITVISAGETSPWDKELLKKISLRAKCQGYVLLVFSLGPTYNHTELEDLASLPLEQHLIQLGRIHQPELKYAQMFLKAFLHLLRTDKTNDYPPVELRAKCTKIMHQRTRYASRSLSLV
uniref:Collagen alpha-6(VI) chain n=1 Tax=Pogona vitticeps TaxID=103695 RepID=A0ABM5GMN7_9SAUR